MDNSEYLDRNVLVLLHDGRCFIGIMRSFKLHGNIVLENAFERIVLHNQYCDTHIGLTVLHVNNIILIGELDPNTPQLPPCMTIVSRPEIQSARTAGRESEELERTSNVWKVEFLE